MQGSVPVSFKCYFREGKYNILLKEIWFSLLLLFP